MTNISEEQALEIAAKYGRQKDFAEFTVDHAVLEGGEWRVFLDFNDAPLGLPGYVVVEVDAETGVANSPRGL